MIVCSGSAEDILKFQVPGYYSSSDYINGMVERAVEYNFYSPNFKFIDAYVRIASEGRDFVTPHIEIKDNKIQMDGTAVFNKDKMVAKLNNKDSKYMNIMRSDEGFGILTLQYESSSYINLNAASKRKVQCIKTEKGYDFNITLLIDGQIASNTTNENLSINPENIVKLEKEFQAQVKKQCEEFISKMQNELKTDCLELGNVAASKYGRRKGIVWNKEVVDANIKVEVKVKISENGRGDF